VALTAAKSPKAKMPLICWCVFSSDFWPNPANGYAANTFSYSQAPAVAVPKKSYYISPMLIIYGDGTLTLRLIVDWHIFASN
jgi:hypothetical protein